LKRSAWLACGVFLLLASSLFAGKLAENDFWTKEKDETETPKSSAIAKYPGLSYVEAGVIYYGKTGDVEDEHRGGMKITASLRDYFEHVHFRLDAWATVGGPAEGSLEAQISLVKGLNVGLGGMHTDHLQLVPRLGLYVEDQNNYSRRMGLYLLGADGGGLEFSWPIEEKWAIHGDLAVEEDHDVQARRWILGLLYRF